MIINYNLKTQFISMVGKNQLFYVGGDEGWIIHKGFSNPPFGVSHIYLHRPV